MALRDARYNDENMNRRPTADVVEGVASCSTHKIIVRFAAAPVVV
jgi:hypothetical protein